MILFAIFIQFNWKKKKKTFQGKHVEKERKRTSLWVQYKPAEGIKNLQL